MTSDGAGAPQVPRATTPRERFLEAVFESAIDYAIIALDIDGLVTAWNTGAERTLGWSEVEILGRPASVFFTPEDRRQGIPQGEMQAALQRGRGSDERWHLKKDGTRFWASGEMMPLQDGAGTVQGFIKILRDRTAQRIADERQRADAEFLRGVLAASADCIMVLDLDARLQFMNAAGRRAMEVADFDALKGARWPEVFGYDEVEAACTAAATAQAGGTGHFQGHARTPGGSAKWWDVQVTPMRDREGEPERLLVVARDVTAARRGEQALREALTLNTMILNSSRDCIVVLDLHARTLFVSPGGIEGMEISDVDAILGLSWLRVWQGKDHAAAVAAVKEACNGGLGRFQGFCATHRGTPKWWDVNISALPGPDGQPERLVSIGRDITEFKQAERSLARAQERLQLALDAAGSIGLFDWDMVADEVHADANFVRIYHTDPGLAGRGVPRREFTRNIHPDDLPVLQRSRERMQDGLDDVSDEYRIVQPGGAVRWVNVRGRLVRDAAGKPARLAGAVVDITERRLAEDHQRMLMQELAHRVKNTLAVVRAIAGQTFQGEGSLDTMGDVFSARIAALGQAHDVLMQGSWTAASLRALVAGAARLHGDGDPGRFRILGPDMTLGPRAALSFALMLHELGTNAVKYGALSNRTGHVAVVWQQDFGAAPPLLRFRWQEVGGPPVAPPTRQGFGSVLIERSLGFEAEVLLRYPPEGVTLTFDAPLDGLREN